MALKLRRGTDAQRQSITPEEGELIYTTDNKEVFVGDGSTTGGVLVTGGGGGGGSTYNISAETATGGVNLRLSGSNGTTDDVKFAAGSNITLTRTDASTITIESTDTGISSVSQDTTPQLGGNLDTNGFDITGTGNITASTLYGTGTSGDLTFYSVDGTTVSGNINIRGVNTTYSGVEGGDINIIAGNGNGTGGGGDILMAGGAGGSINSAGGTLSLVGGYGQVNGGGVTLGGGDGGQTGGNVTIRGGVGVGGNEGTVFIGTLNTLEVHLGTPSTPIHLSSNVTLGGNIIPSSDSAYDLGSSVYKFRDLYLSGTSLWIGDARITNNGSSAVNIPSGSTIGGVPLGPSGSLYIGGPLQADLVLNGYEITGQGNILIGGYVAATSFYGNLIGSDSTTLIDYNLNRVNADINRTGTLTITSSGNIEFSSTNITFPVGATISNLDISQLDDIGNLLSSVGGTLSSNLDLNSFNITGTGNINIIGNIEGSAVKCNVQPSNSVRNIVDVFNIRVDADIYKTDALVIDSPTSITVSAPTIILPNSIDTDDSGDFEIIPGVVMRSNLNVENNLTVTGAVTAGSFISTQTGTPEVFSETNIDLTAGNRVSVTTSPFRLAQFSTAERNNITAQNGDLIYNVTVNKLQGYQNGSWINIDDGSAA